MNEATRKGWFSRGEEIAEFHTEFGGLPWGIEWVARIMEAMPEGPERLTATTAMLEGVVDSFCGWLSKRPHLLTTPEGRLWVPKVGAWKARWAAEQGTTVEEAF